MLIVYWVTVQTYMFKKELYCQANPTKIDYVVNHSYSNTVSVPDCEFGSVWSVTDVASVSGGDNDCDISSYDGRRAG